jgi:ParB-like chromosome segregation protein Spo0J
MEQIMELKNLSVNVIARNPWNPHFATKEELEGILNSIVSKGMRDPILVVEWDCEVNWNEKNYRPSGAYMLVDGEQRFTAYSLGVERGLLPDSIPALVMGKLSEFKVEELIELGQSLNHNRGSGEDLVKTGLIVEALKKRGKTLDELASAMGQPKDFLADALAAINTRTKQVPVRVKRNEEREDIIAVLRFGTEDDHSEFEELLGKTITKLESAGVELPITRRYRRSQAILEVLKLYVSAG